MERRQDVIKENLEGRGEYGIGTQKVLLVTANSRLRRTCKLRLPLLESQIVCAS